MSTGKRYFIILISLMLIAFGGFIPAPEGLSADGMHIVGIFLGCLLLWLTVAIDWPSILCVGALGLFPAIGYRTIFAASFGSSTIVFLMLTFLCTFTLSETPFLKRCAIGFITSRFARQGPWMFALSFFAAVIFIGCFMSPTVLFLIFIPILEEIFEMLNLDKGHKLGAMMMIGLAFCVSISSGMTPIAHVFSIMAIGFYEAATGHTIGYGQYIVFAVPVGLICVALLMAVFKYILRPDMTPLKNLNFSELEGQVKPMEAKERIILGIFALVVALWVLPSLVENTFPVLKVVNKWGPAFPPILGVVLYSIICFDGKPALNFAEGMKRGIPWSSVIMATGTLALGAAMTNPKIGLTKFLVSSLEPTLEGVAPWALVLLFTLWAALQTNLSSNMVTVTVVTAVSIPLTLATDGAVSAPAIVAIIGMMAAYAFATPPAMPHIAIAIGSGWTNTMQVLKYGLLFMSICVAVTVVIGYPIAAAIM